MDKRQEITLAIHNATTYEELVGILNANEPENISFDDIVNKLSIFCNTFDDVDDALRQISGVVSFYSKLDRDRYGRFDGYSNNDFVYGHAKPILNKFDDLGKSVVEKLTSLDEVNEFMKKYDSYDFVSQRILLSWGDTFESLRKKWEDFTGPIVEQMTSLNEIDEFIKKYSYGIRRLDNATKETGISWAPSKIVTQRWNEIALTEIEKMDKEQLELFLKRYYHEPYTRLFKGDSAVTLANLKWTKLARGYDSIFADDMYIGYGVEDPKVTYARQLREYSERLDARQQREFNNGLKG
ncbi:MAG: hypothetical protein PHH83_04940 [Patescibacteria group bacterium]|nr:hypothetical protein [Patescibacteria group bacterium]